MAAVTFVGDEVTAEGFRLAGATTRVASADDVAPQFADALGEAGLVLITASAATGLEPGRLDRAVRAASPLVLVIPDAALRAAPPDLGAAVERALGIAS